MKLKKLFATEQTAVLSIVMLPHYLSRLFVFPEQPLSTIPCGGVIFTVIIVVVYTCVIRCVIVVVYTCYKVCYFWGVHTCYKVCYCCGVHMRCVIVVVYTCVIRCVIVVVYT